MKAKHVAAIAAAGAVVLLLPMMLMQASLTAITSAMMGADISGEEEQCVASVSDDTDVNPELTAALSGNKNAAALAEALLEGEGVDLQGLKFTRVMVAGIIGNFYAESGVTFARAEKKAGNNAGQLDHMSNDNADEWSKGGARGLGIAQWTWNPGRAGNLISTARSMNKNWYDAAPQVQLIIKELAGSYKSSVYEAMAKATDASDAAKIFMEKYEAPASTQSLAARQSAARSALVALDSQNLGATTIADTAGSSTADLVWRSTSSSTRTVKDCDSDGYSSQTSAKAGAVGGAPETRGDYSWMCDTDQKVCKNGDAGVFYPHLEFGYQCVWYAWNRLAMIHGTKGWTWVQGDGGQIADKVNGQVGWTVSDSPQPGDGASGTSQPFAGTTHVAVVEEVKIEGGSWKVRLSEGNFCSASASGCWNGYSGTRWMTKAQMSGVKFFRNSNWT